MKVYISCPITGHDIEKVKEQIYNAALSIHEEGNVAVSPLEVSPNPEASYAEHMGRDIQALLECDAVLFLKGWETSKGCKLEMQAALIYNKQLFFLVVMKQAVNLLLILALYLSVWFILYRAAEWWIKNLI